MSSRRRRRFWRLSKSAGGNEELQRSLVGELLVVPHSEVLKTFGAVRGHRRRFISCSGRNSSPSPPTRSGRQASGLNVRWWDFVFYMLFGLVVTSFVHIGGVLLVFSYLVVPAVCATYLVNSIRRPLRRRLGDRHAGQRGESCSSPPKWTCPSARRSSACWGSCWFLRQ